MKLVGLDTGLQNLRSQRRDNRVLRNSTDTATGLRLSVRRASTSPFYLIKPGKKKT